MQYIKPSTRIRTYDAGNVFGLLNSSEQEIMLNNLVEIQNQSALEKDEEPMERTVMVSKLTEVCGLIKAGIKVFEDTDLNEQEF
jgi:hypothetical protein